MTLLAEDGSGEEVSRGRVEVRYGSDVVGTIVDPDWSLDDAHVVCRQLGYSAGALTNVTDLYVPARGRPLLADVRCTGYEHNLIDCFYRYSSDGDSANLHDVTVACNTSLSGEVSLVVAAYVVAAVFFAVAASSPESAPGRPG